MERPKIFTPMIILGTILYGASRHSLRGVVPTPTPRPSVPHFTPVPLTLPWPSHSPAAQPLKSAFDRLSGIGLGGLDSDQIQSWLVMTLLSWVFSQTIVPVIDKFIVMPMKSFIARKIFGAAVTLTAEEEKASALEKRILEIITAAAACEDKLQSQIDSAADREKNLQELVISVLKTESTLQMTATDATACEEKLASQIGSAANCEKNLQDIVTSALKSESALQMTVTSATTCEEKLQSRIGSAADREKNLQELVTSALKTESTLHTTATACEEKLLSQIDSASEREQKLREVVTSASKTDSDLHKTVTSTTACDEKIQSQIGSATDLEKSLQEVITRALESKSTLEMTVTSATACGEKLQSQVGSATDCDGEVRNSIDQASTSIQKIQTAIAAATARENELAKSVQTTVASATDCDGKLRNSIDHASTSIEKVQTAIAAVTARDIELAESIRKTEDTLQKTVASATACDGKLRNSVDHASASTEKIHTAIAAATARENELAESVQKTENTLQKTVASATACDGKLRNSVDHASASTEKIQTALAAATACESELAESVRKTEDTLQKTVASATAELAESVRKTAEEEIAKLTKEGAQLQLALSLNVQEYSAQKEKFESLIGQASGLHGELDRCIQKTQDLPRHLELLIAKQDRFETSSQYITEIEKSFMEKTQIMGEKQEQQIDDLKKVLADTTKWVDHIHESIKESKKEHTSAEVQIAVMEPTALSPLSTMEARVNSLSNDLWGVEASKDLRIKGTIGLIEKNKKQMRTAEKRLQRLESIFWIRPQQEVVLAGFPPGENLIPAIRAEVPKDVRAVLGIHDKVSPKIVPEPSSWIYNLAMSVVKLQNAAGAANQRPVVGLGSSKFAT